MFLLIKNRISAGAKFTRLIRTWPEGDSIISYTILYGKASALSASSLFLTRRVIHETSYRREWKLYLQNYFPYIYL